MKNISLLYRGNSDDEELNAAATYFKVYTNRAEIPSKSLVIGRYSVLPYYNELEDELKHKQSSLINSLSQHRYIADIGNYYKDFIGITPETWTNLNAIPENGPFILKGETNSKKFLWKTHMFAENKKDAIDVYCRLQDDGIISNQNIYIRKYVKLKTFEIGFNNLPITNEYRIFIAYGKVVSVGYYWSNYYEDLVCKYDLDIKQIPQKFIQEIIYRVGKNANFYVVDVAQKENGDWIVIELNDGQMSGLSMNNSYILYENLYNIISLI